MIDKEKRNQRQYIWQKENTDRINFTMPKGTKEKIQAAADAEGVKVAEWMRRAIWERLNEPPPGDIEELTHEPFFE